jgi:membrane AbrB-like protein
MILAFYCLATYFTLDVPVAEGEDQLRILETFIVAFIGSTIFYFIKIPLPWMLGSLSAVLLWNGYTKRKIIWPKSIWYAGLIVVGYTIGSTFTQDTARMILLQLPVMALVTMVTIFFNLLMGYLTYCKTDISLASGLMGSIPGGLSQIAALCTEIEDADLTVVTFMQTARALSVVFVVPFLAINGLGGSLGGGTALPPNAVIPMPDISLTNGLLLLVIPLSGYLAKRFHLPTPYLLGPVIGAACLGLTGVAIPLLPRTWTNVAQLCIGTYTGARMNTEELKSCKQLVPFTITSLTGLLLLSLGIGWLLNHYSDIPLITAFLSTAPGGIAEMSLTAIQVHADLSIIVAYQLFRLLFILLIVPPVLKWWLMREKVKEKLI